MKGSMLCAMTVAGAAVALGCASQSAAPKAPEARADIEAKSGSTVRGWALVTELPAGGAHVHVYLEHTPPGTHGLHIHEKGDCSDPEGKNAGGHFNPAGMPHAGPTAMQRHAGDLGNIEITWDGTGYLDVDSDMLTVRPGPNSVVGRSVIVHEKSDDMTTQPTGNAGGRIGCGVFK
jgi:Cu-Zn family superoxide dismutase